MGFLKSVVSKLPQGCQQQLRFWHYSRKLAAARVDDEAELGAVSLMVKPGQTVMDIGANFGLFTRFLSEAVGPEGKVYSFEPTDDMFGVLDHNVSHFGYRNAKVTKVALSDMTGEAEIHIPRREDGTLNHYEASVLPVDESTESVSDRIQLITLDQFCEGEGIEQIDFIKCDVEGHEIAVLSGGEQMLRACHPPILLEVNEPLDDGAHGTHVRELVESFGYAVHVYEDGQTFPWKPGEVRVNYLLLPSVEGSEID